jgi:Tol biopolymer transport system component
LLAACSAESPQPVALSGDASEGLVFVRRGERSLDLHRARLADGAVRPLRVTPERDERWPYWSSRAGRLLFQSRAANGPAGDRLLLLDPASGATRPLSERAADTEHWPVWSPDGTRVAFVFVGRSGVGASAGLGEIAWADGRMTVLGAARGGIHFFRPEYAPDGRRLVAQRADGEERSTIWLLEPGGSPRRLTEGDRFEQKAHFTRDGEWIVYTRWNAARTRGNVFAVRADGSQLRRLVRPPGYHDHTANPSPTRDELVFISNRGGNPDVYRIAFAGGRSRRLTRTPGRQESAPRWSPDGERVVLTVRQLSEEVEGEPPIHHVVVIDREGRVLLDVPGMMPDWMPPWP